MRAVAMLLLLTLALVAASIMGLAWWAQSIEGSSRALMSVLDAEELTVSEWWWKSDPTDPDEEPTHFVVTLEQYNMDPAAFAAGVRALQEEFPSNARPPEGGEDGGGEGGGGGEGSGD